MALNFPSNPVDGQRYPQPAIAGATQYVWVDSKGTWLTVFKGVERVEAIAPITNTGNESVPQIGITPATPTQDGSMTAADKAKLDTLTPSAGTITAISAGVGIGAPNLNDTITTVGTINLLAPTPIAIGGVRAGPTVSITTTDGIIDIKPASTLRIGGVKPGPGLEISPDGTMSLADGGSFANFDDISRLFDNSRTTFPLAVNGVPYFPTSSKSLLIFVGGVNQSPLLAFTVSGSNITFSGPPPVGASFDGVSLT